MFVKLCGYKNFKLWRKLFEYFAVAIMVYRGFIFTQRTSSIFLLWIFFVFVFLFPLIYLFIFLSLSRSLPSLCLSDLSYHVKYFFVVIFCFKRKRNDHKLQRRNKKIERKTWTFILIRKSSANTNRQQDDEQIKNENHQTRSMT